MRKKRLVVKAGSLSVATENGHFRRNNKDIAEMLIYAKQELGYQVALISSAAILIGRQKVSFDNGGDETTNLQTLAMVGQPRLHWKWQQAFGDELIVAQALYDNRQFGAHTRDDVVKALLNTIGKKNVIALINENDATTDAEIRIGDNDILAGHVAKAIEAEHLIFLTTEEGVVDPDTKQVYRHLCPKDKGILRRIDGKSGNEGGMHEKLKTAFDVCESVGTIVTIAHYRNSKVIAEVLDGEEKINGTQILPQIKTA